MAVLGSPIAHSKSPALHSAAYRVLGLPWTYEAVEVREDELGEFLAGLDDEWRGLSLTMPLKRDVIRHLTTVDDFGSITGAVNTVLVGGDALRGFNTDVSGAERMLAEAFPDPLDSALLLGSGATAGSLLVALSRRGVRRVTVWARSLERAAGVEAVAERVGVSIDVQPFGSELELPDVVVSTLPGTAELPMGLPRGLCSTVPLVDIAYAPQPTAAARSWRDEGGAIVNNGIGMLVYQALAQVRIFVGGDPEIELPDEGAVLAAMRGAAFGTA
nr:shikimate dehydrogenase [Terrimesophilobacter mesophilus]